MPLFHRKPSPTVLIIDQQIPMPDRDSGSVRAAYLVRILRELGCRITFAALSGRAQPGYATALRQIGVEVLEAAESQSVGNWLRRNGPALDYVILSRLPVAEAMFDEVRDAALSAKIIFDTVDLHWLREEREARLKRDPKALEQALLMKCREVMIANSVDETWVVSPVEKNILRESGCISPIKVISNIVDICQPRRSFEERSGFLFIGSFRHRPNVDAMEYFISEIYPLLPPDLRQVPFYIIGENPPDSITRHAGGSLIVTGHVASVEKYFEEVRLSIAPLRYGAGVKGKINQSMAMGVPVVASPEAAEGMGFAAGRELSIGSGPADFAQAMVSLYRDRELWQAHSAQGISVTESRYGVGAARSELEQRIC